MLTHRDDTHRLLGYDCAVTRQSNLTQNLGKILYLFLTVFIVFGMNQISNSIEHS